MTATEFKKKWSRYQGKETSAYQSHFDDLCRLLGEQTPNEADPSGMDFFVSKSAPKKDFTWQSKRPYSGLASSAGW